MLVCVHDSPFCFMNSNSVAIEMIEYLQIPLNADFYDFAENVNTRVLFDLALVTNEDHSEDDNQLSN